MTRRLAISGLLLSMAGCSEKKQSLKDMLPIQVQRAWTLQDTQTLQPSEAPEVLRGLGVDQAIEARYAGNGAIKVRVYRMRGAASAFEAVQKWPQNDTLAFDRGPYFITVLGEGVDRQSLIGFLQALNTDLKVPA